jgi:putative ABC transport system ATP-binding protein
MAVVETHQPQKGVYAWQGSSASLRGRKPKVEEGELLSVLGPSRSGKSTLLNLIGALDKPTSGKVLIDGIDVSTLNDSQLASLRRKIGFVFQFFNLIPRLTALENVELPMAIAGFGKEKRRNAPRNFWKQLAWLKE